MILLKSYETQYNPNKIIVQILIQIRTQSWYDPGKIFVIATQLPSTILTKILANPKKILLKSK